MRLLHTADWHVGKKLGRVDRSDEFQQAIDEVVAIAKDQKVDAAIVAGDLFDRSNPPLDSLGLAVDGLFRLAAVAGHVVVICGNHDSSHLFGFLRPLLEARGVLLVPRLRRPDEGGIVRIPSRSGDEIASVAAVPFLNEAEVIRDFMIPVEEWYKGYAEKIRSICHAMCQAIDPSTIGILAGHFFVEGAEIGGGERKIHIGPQYAATVQAIPPTIHYAAMGHVHRPQEIKGAPVRARYAGSLIQLDFSERTHSKEVVIVDAKAGAPAKPVSIQLAAGKKLIRVTDQLESLRARVGEFRDAYLDVRVETEGPVLGLAHQVREFLPNALLVQAVYERRSAEGPIAGSSERTLAEQYADYYLHAHGVDIDERLREILRTLEEEVVRAAS